MAAGVLARHHRAARRRRLYRILEGRDQSCSNACVDASSIKWKAAITS